MRNNLANYRLNLANRPFVNTSPLWITLIILGGLAVIFTAINLYVALGPATSAKESSERIEELNAAMEEMRTDIRQIDARLATYNPALIRGQVDNANDLITRRTMSWSLIFSRLEDLVPAELKMVRISPRTRAGEIELSFRVIVPRQEVIRTFITSLESSPHFSDVRLESEVTDLGKGEIVWELSTLYHEDGEEA